MTVWDRERERMEKEGRSQDYKNGFMDWPGHARHPGVSLPPNQKSEDYGDGHFRAHTLAEHEKARIGK